jgi:hypothetical protein
MVEGTSTGTLNLVMGGLLGRQVNITVSLYLVTISCLSVFFSRLHLCALFDMFLTSSICSYDFRFHATKEGQVSRSHEAQPVTPLR